MRFDISNETIKNSMFDIIASLAIRDEEFIKILSTNLVSMYDKDGLPYERITDYVYNSDFNENNIQIIDENLQAIKKYISNNVDVVETGFEEKHLNIIPKVDRHYKMAYVQKKFILKNGTEAQKIAEEAKEVSEEAKSMSEEAKSMSEEAGYISKDAKMLSEQTKIVSENVEKDTKKSQEKLKQIENIKGQIYTEFIAILGIFSALIFGLFGGFDAISNIVQTTFKSGVELPNIMIAISLTLGSLSLLLFSLMQGIKILSKSTLKSCGCQNGGGCKHSIFQRHPVMSLNLIALSSVFIVSLLIKIIPRGTFEILYKSDQYLYYGLVLIGILLISIMIKALNSSELKKEEKKKKKSVRDMFKLQ